MAFQTFKRSLTTAPIIAYPKEIGEFILDTDASNAGIGAVLSQRQNGVCQPHDVKTRNKLLRDQNGTVSSCHVCKVLPSLSLWPEIRDPH